VIPRPWHKDVRLLESRIRVLAGQGLRPAQIADTLMMARTTLAKRMKDHPRLLQAWRQEAALYEAKRLRTVDALAFADASDDDAVERVRSLSILMMQAGMDHTARRGYMAIWAKLQTDIALDRVIYQLEEEGRGSQYTSWAELALSARERLKNGERNRERTDNDQ